MIIKSQQKKKLLKKHIYKNKHFFYKSENLFLKQNKMNSTNQTNNSTWTLNDIISFHYLPYTVLNIIGMLVGVFGNLLILSAILLTKQLQNTANILIFNLSFAHLFVAGFIDSAALIGI